MHPTPPRCAKLGDGAIPNCRTAKNHPEQSQRTSARDCGIEPLRIYGALGRGILPRMTRHKHAQTGLVTPSPLDHWIDATLHVLAMLVLHVASTLQMIRRRTRVNATRTTPADLPQAKTDTQSKETNSAAQHRSYPQSAHAEQARFASRPSKHERVLTTPSTTPSVSHATRAIHLPHTPCGGGKQRPNARDEGELPPPVRSTGGGGLRALARKTEGAQAKPTVHSGSVHSMHAFPAKAGIQPSEQSARLVSPKHGEGGSTHHLTP